MTEQDRLVAGRYRLGERVGVGAMGVVWRARDERLRRTVAVKQLLLQPGLDGDKADEARQRAMREARIAARLQHANVVIVYDVAEDDGQPWLIMEYVPSKSLATALQDSGPMQPYQVAGIGAQAAAGLAAAHAVGVVHRDVKPGNVLLGDDGVVKITDFGISRAVDDVVLTATGLLTGTPAYLAPEMAKGENPAPPSDVFALGATLYAAVEGSPPFGLSENPLALLRLVADGKITPPNNAGPLTGTLMNLLCPNPNDRPTMREAQERLTALAAERTLSGATPTVDPLRAWTTPGGTPVVKPAPPAPGAVLAANLVNVLPSPPPPTRISAGPRRRRGPVKLALVLVLVVLAVGTAVLLVNATGRNNGAAAAPPTASTQAHVPTAAPTTNDDGTPTFAAMTDLVSRYYNLLPGNLAAAYQLLAPGYRAVHPFGQFATFYNGIQTVTAGSFQRSGPNTIRAVITFLTVQGALSHEPYSFTIGRRHGKLIIETAVQLDRSKI